MKHAIVLAALVSAGMGFGMGTARAEAIPHLSEQCPNAAAFLKAKTERRHAQESKLETIRPSNPALAAQLAQRFARDQAAEDGAIKAHSFDKPKSETDKQLLESKAVKHLLAVQNADLVWLKPIVAAHGFPTVQQVGLKGVKHAWMLVQHSEMDPKFQAKVLAELNSRLAAEPFLRNDYALLADRVRRAQNKPQIYGTQFTFKDGHLVMQPTEDVVHLDKRRASMNLMPISDYRCFLTVIYDVPEHATPHHRAAVSK